MSEKIKKEPLPYDGIVYLFQGGGALGAYQVGVSEALFEHGCEPTWVIGNSIGAINGAIIVGNKPDVRIPKLKEFWNTIASPLPDWFFSMDNDELRNMQNFLSSGWTALHGQKGFFGPKSINPWFFEKNSINELSFYDTSELKNTLEKFIDFNLLNQKKIRLTLGAVSVEDGNRVCFDNSRQEVGPLHIMASAALPPGFPAITIDGKNYWDGGISSNTPLNVILEENISQKLLCFMVNLFPLSSKTPESIFEVFKRKKDIELSSRHREVIRQFCKIHGLKHTIHQLSKIIEKNKLINLPNEFAKQGCSSAINIVRFLYEDHSYDLWSSDFEFSRSSMQDHIEMGYAQVKKALENPTWLEVIQDDVGVVLREP